ncbi:unnamed protein product, partial [Acanthoscelides obtectus]
ADGVGRGSRWRLYAHSTEYILKKKIGTTHGPERIWAPQPPHQPSESRTPMNTTPQHPPSGSRTPMDTTPVSRYGVRNPSPEVAVEENWMMKQVLIRIS